MANFGGGISNLVALIMICGSIHGVPAAIYTVGDSSGWSMGGGYGSWASDKTFTVGDTLVFNYASGHTVDEVSTNDYKTCTTGNAITTDSSGATTITLNTAGPHYFICGIPGHCGGGMKLMVNVVAASGGDSSSRTTTSPPTITSPPSTTAAPPLTTDFPPSTSISPAPTTGGSQHLTRPSSSAVLFTPKVAVLFTISIVVLKSFL
ncbi:chemocyanin-like [Primulina tabacum]|uniref:chemocyanin-like n=1 Tax=Primulina tabacum TaxID=48773 RepID=UPI003F5A54FA